MRPGSYMYVCHQLRHMIALLEHCSDMYSCVLHEKILGIRFE